MTDYRNEPINLALREHQVGAKDWGFRELSADLHVWAERMDFEFKLGIGSPALAIEHLRVTRLGHYRHGRNGFGLRDEIAISEGHARDNPYWQVLGTLLHELLHSWQEHNGQPGKWNYHNVEFRGKGEGLGLIVDQRGHTQYAPGDTPFLGLLRKYGIEVPHIPKPELPPARPSRSTLTLYRCPCGVRVRVGRSRFNAQCLDCGGLFERQG